MAKKTNKLTEFKRFGASLREFVDSLPSVAEREELQRNLTEIIRFLSDTQRLLAAMPTREERPGIDDALRAFDQLAERAKGNPAIAALLGIPQPRPSRPKSTTFAPEELAAGQQLLAEMQALTIDEMRNKLGDETAVPLRSLQALASHLGIRSVQRMGRGILAHQVASKIANYRGYQGLQAGSGAT